MSTFVTRVLSMFTQHNSVKQQMSASIKRSHSPCHNHSDTVFGPTSNTPWLLASTAESPILFPLVLQQADLLPAVPEQPGGYKEGQALLGENLEYFLRNIRDFSTARPGGHLPAIYRSVLQCKKTALDTPIWCCASK